MKFKPICSQADDKVAKLASLFATLESHSEVKALPIDQCMADARKSGTTLEELLQQIKQWSLPIDLEQKLAVINGAISDLKSKLEEVTEYLQHCETIQEQVVVSHKRVVRQWRSQRGNQTAALVLRQVPKSVAHVASWSQQCAFADVPDGIPSILSEAQLCVDESPDAASSWMVPAMVGPKSGADDGTKCQWKAALRARMDNDVEAIASKACCDDDDDD